MPKRHAEVNETYEILQADVSKSFRMICQFTSRCFWQTKQTRVRRTRDEKDGRHTLWSLLYERGKVKTPLWLTQTCKSFRFFPVKETELKNALPDFVRKRKKQPTWLNVRNHKSHQEWKNDQNETWYTRHRHTAQTNNAIELNQWKQKTNNPIA